MNHSSHRSGDKIENDIPNWVIYALLALVGLLVAKSIHGTLVTLTASGIAIMLGLFYMSKPVAEIQTVKEESDSNQLNLFHKKHKIGKKYATRKSGTTEPSGQRKRYLKTLEEERKKAA